HFLRQVVGGVIVAAQAADHRIDVRLVSLVQPPPRELVALLRALDEDTLFHAGPFVDGRVQPPGRCLAADSSKLRRLRHRRAPAQDTTAAGTADPAISAETDELLRGMGLSGDDLDRLDPARLHGECVEASDVTGCVYTYDTDSFSECRAMAAIGVAVRASR